jgi:hypothetical protein
MQKFSYGGHEMAVKSSHHHGQNLVENSSANEASVCLQRVRPVALLFKKFRPTKPQIMKTYKKDAGAVWSLSGLTVVFSGFYNLVYYFSFSVNCFHSSIC